MKSLSVLLVLAFLLTPHLYGVEGLLVNVLVPQGTESVNGSSVDMGCTSPLVDSRGVMVCESQSYLVDGCSPDIDTSTSDWASQLVTVRRNEGTAGINFPHVLLTFGFDTAVSLTGIEMDLFNCPDWNIGIPSITVYLNPDYNLAATTNILFSLPFASPSHNSLQSSCDSLSTVTFSGGSFGSGSYHTVYFLVDLSHTSSIQWVHVGEVRFIGQQLPECQVFTTTTVAPSSTSVIAETTSLPTTSLPGPTSVYTTISTPTISSINIIRRTSSLTPDISSSTASLLPSPTVSLATETAFPVTTSAMPSPAISITSSAIIELSPSRGLSRHTIFPTSTLLTQVTVFTATTAISSSVVYSTASASTLTSTTLDTMYSPHTSATSSPNITVTSTTTTVYSSYSASSTITTVYSSFSGSTSSSTTTVYSPPPITIAMNYSSPTNPTTVTSLLTIATPTSIKVSTIPPRVPSMVQFTPVSKGVATTYTTSSTTPNEIAMTPTIPSLRTVGVYLPTSTSLVASTSIPVPPPGKDQDIVLSLAAAIASVILLIIIVAITVVVLVLYKKGLKRDSYNVDSYIAIGPLAPARMDVPEEEEELGVHKVTAPTDHENGNIYEVAK